MILIKMHLQTLHELCEIKEKVKERKDRLWQLLLQRNTVQPTPTTQAVVAPFSSPAYVTSIQRIFHKV